MANEAAIVEKMGNGGDPYDVTCAASTAISKGTLIRLTDPRTGSASVGAGDVILGIAGADKDGDDTGTNVAVLTNVIADVLAQGNIVTGAYVAMSGANIVKAATNTEITGGKVVGKALEGCVSGTEETIEVRILL